MKEVIVDLTPGDIFWGRFELYDKYHCTGARCLRRAIKDGHIDIDKDENPRFCRWESTYGYTPKFMPTRADRDVFSFNPDTGEEVNMMLIRLNFWQWLATVIGLGWLFVGNKKIKLKVKQ